MRLDSICTLKSALRGTATSKFTDVMEAVIGVEEDFVPKLEEEEPDEAEEEMPAEGVITKGAEGDPKPSTSKGVKHKASSSTASKRKQSKSTKAGVCLLKDATPLFPSDPKGYLHTGVLPKYISKREGSKYSQTAVYICEYAKAEQAKGKNVPDYEVMCQQKARVSSHIQQFHLGNCIACYLCNHKWWSATEWHKHMKEVHSSLSEDAWYVAQGDPSQQIIIKTEVTKLKLRKVLSNQAEQFIYLCLVDLCCIVRHLLQSL